MKQSLVYIFIALAVIAIPCGSTQANEDAISPDDFWTRGDELNVWFYYQYNKCIIPLFNKTIGEMTTGILMGHGDKLYVITNKHLLHSNSDEIIALVNTKKGKLQKTGCMLFKAHESLDLAAFLITLDLSDSGLIIQHLEDGFIVPDGSGKYVLDLPDENKRLMVPDNLAEPGQIQPGREIFFIGYPLGEGINRSERTKAPLFRKGMIASEENSGLFFVDAMTNHGNSGSPVFVRWRSNKKLSLRLVGILMGFSADNIDFKADNGQILSLPHNSGLGVAISVRAIKEFVEGLDSK